MASSRFYVSVGVLSFVVILLELLQTRVLAFIFSNHIVYLTISIALLGFGISGTLVGMNMSKISKIDNAISLFLLLLGLSVWLGIAAIVLLPISTMMAPLLKLACCYLMCLFPFVFAGSVLSILFATAGCAVGSLYAVDLLSAGAACIVFFFLLPILGAGKLMGCVITLCAVLIFLWTNKQNKRMRLLTTILCALGLIVMIVPIDHWMTPEPYKSFSKIMSVPGSKIERTVWTPLCRTDILGIKQSSLFRVANANSFPEFSGLDFESGPVKLITQDGIAPMLMCSYPAILKALEETRPGIVYSDRDIVYVIRHAPTVAIIGLGGGYDVVLALAHGAKDVYGAEINPAIFHALMHDYFDYHGYVYERNNLHLYNEEGRSMLGHLDCKFDVLCVQHAFTHDATLSNGAYAYSENYLYTVEALKEFYKYLKPDGILSITRREGVEGLRLISLACQSLRESGCHPVGNHIVAMLPTIGNERCVQLLVKNQPFTNGEVQALLAASKRLGHTCVLYNPGMTSQVGSAYSLNQYQQLPSDIADQQDSVIDLISSFDKGKEENIFASYPYVITPTRDDCTRL